MFAYLTIDHPQRLKNVPTIYDIFDFIAFVMIKQR